MNQIDAPANKNYKFGKDFNYAAWTPGTVVDLVNVPWNNDYRDIVNFRDQASLNRYIDGLGGQGITITRLSYAKPNEPVMINKPLNVLQNYNYLRVHNPAQPIGGNDTDRFFYYFITDVQYIAPDTTAINVQLDVWQTYGYRVKFGNCYVERGHIGIANSKSMDAFGRDYLTTPEGLDIGGEYRVIARRREPIMGTTVTSGPNDTLGIKENYDILVVSTGDLLASPVITASDGTTRPNFVAAGGGFFELLPTGADVYVFQGASEFTAFLQGFKEYPWMSQAIISITIVPKLNRYVPDFVYHTDGTPTPVSAYMPTPKKHKFFLDWRNSQEIANAIPARYRGLKKLYTYPYMAIELTSYNGTPVALKPESWNDPDAFVMERISYTPPNQRVEFSPRRYNSNGQPIDSYNDYPETIILSSNRDGYRETGDDSGDYLDITSFIANFPTVLITNSGQLSYLAANANQIAYQFASADWSQQRQLHANQVSYDQASSGMQLANRLTGVGVDAATQQMQLQNNVMQQKLVTSAISTAARGVVGGAAAGGGVGAVAGLGVGAIGVAADAINTGIDVNANTQSTGISNSAARQGTSAANENRGYIRDTNRQLADWAAKGNYENEIGATLAKVQDARLIQPTTSGQMGGQAINLVNGTTEVSLRWKLIDNAAIARVGEYWLRYGYSIQRFIRMPDSLTVMSKFTYWKLSESYIIAANMPESFKQVIRGIFEKGVTVWNSPNDIGNIDLASNTPLSGISY